MTVFNFVPLFPHPSSKSKILMNVSFDIALDLWYIICHFGTNKTLLINYERKKKNLKKHFVINNDIKKKQKKNIKKTTLKGLFSVMLKSPSLPVKNPS